MYIKSTEAGKTALVEEVCTRYLKLMREMQKIESKMNDLSNLMEDLDFDVTLFVRNAKSKEK